MDIGGLIKGNFVDLLAPTIPVVQEVESYIKMKMYGLQTALTQMAFFSEAELVRFFRKALEAPTHVARKMLIYKDALGGDSKREVQERYRETMPAVLSKRFDYLLSLDRSYSMDLEIQMEEPNQEKYRKTLDQLQKQLPKVLAFLRANILVINDAR